MESAGSRLSSAGNTHPYRAYGSSGHPESHSRFVSIVMAVIHVGFLPGQQGTDGKNQFVGMGVNLGAFFAFHDEFTFTVTNELGFQLLPPCIPVLSRKERMSPTNRLSLVTSPYLLPFSGYHNCNYNDADAILLIPARAVWLYRQKT